MKLRVADEASLDVGTLVVLTHASEPDGHSTLLFVESRKDGKVYLAPVQMFLDHRNVVEVLTTDEIAARLRLPEFEPGDPVLFRGEPGVIGRPAAPDGLHLFVQLASQAKEIYTNVVHVDFSPTLRRDCGMAAQL